MHHGESRREDMKLINSRVIGENLALPSLRNYKEMMFLMHVTLMLTGIYFLTIFLQLFLKNVIQRNIKHLKFLNRPLLLEGTLVTVNK